MWCSACGVCVGASGVCVGACGVVCGGACGVIGWRGAAWVAVRVVWWCGVACGAV